MGRRIDLVEFVKDVLDEVADIEDGKKEAIRLRLQTANASRAADLQNLLLGDGDDD